MIHKITPSVYYKYWLKRLDATSNPNSIKVPRVVKKKRYYKTLGTSVLQPNVSFLPGKSTIVNKLRQINNKIPI